MNFTAEESKSRKFSKTVFAIHYLAPYLVIPVAFYVIFMGCKGLNNYQQLSNASPHPAMLWYLLQIGCMGEERQLKYFSFFNASLSLQ